LEASALLLQCHFGLDLLRQATARPSLDFAPDYRQGAMLLLPHLSEIKRSAQLLSAAAVCDLERGDSAAAFTNVCMMLALERKWGNEPIVISQLVRIAMVQITVGPSWELLQSPDVSEKQLETLQADWGDLEFIRSAENAFVMERATEEITFTHLRGSNSPLESLSLYGADSGSSSGGGGSGNWLEDLQDYSKSVWRGTKLKSKEILWRVSWSYTDELHALQGQQVLLDTVRLVRTNGFYMDALAAQKKRLDELGFDKLEDVEGLLTLMTSDPADLDVRWIFTSSVLSLRSYINKLLYAETARQLAVTAIALKRYQLRHGTLPSELTALVPEFLPAVPRDPVDGQPLRYHLNADGTFLLYSIGEDAVDDGGDAKPAKNPKSRAWQRGRDWVWPQPATAQEIRDYENDRLTGKD
jgi:hypothetical protein